MSTTSQAKKPQTYKFKDWDFFCKDVLRYHEATRPNDKLISDYIETFVEFMESDAVKHLDDLMVPHPRYKTTVGKDAWLDRVRRVLSKKDKSAESPITVEDSKSQYVAKKTTLAEFWAQLDRLVLLEEITSKEQRELFWESLPWEVQVDLVKQCAYFDPHHDAWKGEDPGALKEAEQSLSWTISYMKCKDDIKSAKGFALLIGSLLLVLCTLMLVLSRRLSAGEDWASAMTAIGFAFSAVFSLVLLFVLIFHLAELREMQRQEQKVFHPSNI